MTHTQIQNERNKRAQATSKVKVASDSHVVFIAWSFLLALFLTLALGSQARADIAPAEQIAALPPAPVLISGACQNGTVVFTVQNKARAWAARGWLQITDATSGRTLRKRHMALGDNQTASFRIQSGEADTHRYRVAVVLPGQSMTRVRSFAGRCVRAPKSERMAQR